MIENKKSTSDRILEYAKRKGYINENSIYKENSKELALYCKGQFNSDLVKIKKKLKSISKL